jgi:hypothetical protein
MLAGVAACGGVWQRQCGQLGWDDGVRRADAFSVYSARMRARTRVRLQVRVLLSYLPRRTAAAFEPGAAPQRLAAAEVRLGVSLPWEVSRREALFCGMEVVGPVVKACLPLGLIAAGAAPLRSLPLHCAFCPDVYQS